MVHVFRYCLLDKETSMKKFLMVLLGCAFWAGSVSAPLGDGADIPTFGSEPVGVQNPAFRLRRTAVPVAPALPPPPPLPAAKDVPASWVPALPPPPSEPHPDGEGRAGAGASGSASDSSTSASESEGPKGRKARVKTAGSVREPFKLALQDPGSVGHEDLAVLQKRFAATVYRNNALKLKTGYEAKKTKLGFGAPKLTGGSQTALNAAVYQDTHGRRMSMSLEHEHAFLTHKIAEMDKAHDKATRLADHAKARSETRAAAKRK